VPLRTLVEILHIIAGLAATALIVELSAWGYPLGTRTIWIVGGIAALVVLAMGVGPVRRAWAADRAEKTARD
jgi:hypothetical protein